MHTYIHKCVCIYELFKARVCTWHSPNMFVCKTLKNISQTPQISCMYVCVCVCVYIYIYIYIYIFIDTTDLVYVYVCMYMYVSV